MTTLANIIFPMWFIVGIPSVLWVIMLLGNFVIDSLVVLGWAKIKKIQSPKQLWKKSILQVWLFGFLCDFLASAVLILFYLLFIDQLENVNMNFRFGLEWGVGAVIYGFIGALIGMALIFWFDRKWAFKKTELNAEEKKSLAFWLAILTAPYLMMIPLY